TARQRRGCLAAPREWRRRQDANMVHLTTEVIDYHTLTDRVRNNGCGAVVTFLGTVRELTADRRTAALDYEAYHGMAEKKMAEIETEVRNRWPVGDVVLIHR